MLYAFWRIDDFYKQNDIRGQPGISLYFNCQHDIT